MDQSNPNLDQFKDDPKAASILNNKKLLNELLESPDTKKLIDLLNKNGGDSLKSAAESAAKGETEDLMSMLNKIMKSEEGSQAVSGIKEKLPKQK